MRFFDIDKYLCLIAEIQENVRVKFLCREILQPWMTLWIWKILLVRYSCDFLELKIEGNSGLNIVKIV